MSSLEVSRRGFAPFALLKAKYKNAIIATDGERPELRFDVDDVDVARDGYAVSYQIFEPATGVLLVEGERTPAASGRFLLPLTLPQDDGKYQLYASLMHEDHGWAYASGLPFVLADLRIDRGALRVDRIEVTDLNRVRRRRRLNAVPYALIQPFRTVWRNRSLSATLVRREILSRSRGSFFGALWTILNPLLLMITYFYVFGIVLKARFANDPSPASFALILSRRNASVDRLQRSRGARARRSDRIPQLDQETRFSDRDTAGESGVLGAGR